MLLYLTIKPNQRSNRVERSGDGWVIRLAAPPVDGKANEELVLFLSKLLGLPKSSVRVVKGQTSRLKCIDIPLEKDQVDRLLVAAIG